MRIFNFLPNNGHGGEINGKPVTAGKRSPDIKGQYRFIEGTFNREIVDKLCVKLGGLQRRPMNIHKICDTLADKSNYERVLLANQIGLPVADSFYLGVHADAVPTWYIKEGRLWRRADMNDSEDYKFIIANQRDKTKTKGKSEWRSDVKGMSIWTCKGQTKSDLCADIIYEELVKFGVADMIGGIRTDKWSDGDIDKEANFYEIYRTAMPAVLIETGFMTNKENVIMMKSDVFQEAYTNALSGATKRIRKELYNI